MNETDPNVHWFKFQVVGLTTVKPNPDTNLSASKTSIHKPKVSQWNDPSLKTRPFPPYELTRTDSEPELINWSFSPRRTGSGGRSGSGQQPGSSRLLVLCVSSTLHTLTPVPPAQPRPCPAPLLHGGPPLFGRHAYQWFTRDGGEGTRAWDEEVQRQRGEDWPVH